MLRSAGFIARKDVAYALRGTETRLWTFVMPILFFWFIGTVTGSFGGQGGVKDHIVVLAPDSAGPLADEVIRRLEAEDFEVVVVKTAAEFEERSGWRRRLVLPADFSASAGGTPPHFTALAASSCRRRASSVLSELNDTTTPRSCTCTAIR